MADFNSSLPVRTETNGDIKSILVDFTNPTTQGAKVDTHGSQWSVIANAAGTACTSQANGGQQALDVLPQSAGPVSPGTVANYSDLIGGQFLTTLPTLTNAQQSAIQLDSRGRIWVTDSNLPVVVDINYGTVGASTIRTAAQIGNASGAADFGFAASTGQTLRVAALIGNANGVVDYNFAAATAQTIRVAALLGNAAGVIDYNYGTVDAQSIRTAAQIGNATGAADFNYGTVGAQTLRIASQIGNSTGAANYGNGATGVQTLRVAANLAVAGADVTALNPVPVTIVSTVLGTNINSYHTTVNLAAGASVNHSYSVTATKTFTGKKFWAAASGKIRMDVQTSPDGTTFSTFWTGFNSTSDPNVSVDLDLLDITDTGTGSVIRIVIINRDLSVFDVYSTISGVEN